MKIQTVPVLHWVKATVQTNDNASHHQTNSKWEIKYPVKLNLLMEYTPRNSNPILSLYKLLQMPYNTSNHRVFQFQQVPHNKNSSISHVKFGKMPILLSI